VIPGAQLYALGGVWITCLALYFLLVERDLFRRILAANVMGTGIFLLLVSLARRSVEGPPDPVPHAMVLTGIVVAVSATGLLLALLTRLGGGAEGEAPPATAGEDPP